MGIRIEIPPGATPIAAIDAIMALFGRENVELAIETLIERLDQVDGDPDAEPDDDPEEDDHSATSEDMGDYRGEGFDEIYRTLPTYALDQSEGPTNIELAYRAWQKRP